MTPTQILAANTTAAVFPRTFKTAAGRQFITPRVRKQTDRGRDWLDSLDQDSFDGPQGRQRVYRGGDGPLVMFQHGWEADSADLSTLGEAVMEAGFSVALIDGPAHGGSEGRRAHMLLFAEGLGAAGRALGQPYAMVAHSMGFPATVMAMVRHGFDPGRIVSLGAPDALPRNVDFQGRAMGLSQRAIRLTLEAVGERFGEPADNLDVTLYAEAVARPLCVLHGGNDQIAPPQGAERIAAAWPGATLAILDELGHRGILRDDRVVERVLGFLA